MLYVGRKTCSIKALLLPPFLPSFLPSLLRAHTAVTAVTAVTAITCCHYVVIATNADSSKGIPSKDFTCGR